MIFLSFLSTAKPTYSDIVMGEGSYVIYNGVAQLWGLIPKYIDEYHNESYTQHVNMSDIDFLSFLLKYPTNPAIGNLTIKVLENYVEYMTVEVELGFVHNNQRNEFSYLYERDMIRDRYIINVYRDGNIVKIGNGTLPFVFITDVNEMSEIYSREFLIGDMSYSFRFGPFNFERKDSAFILLGQYEFQILLDNMVPYIYSTDSTMKRISVYNTIGIALEVDTILTFLVGYGYIVEFQGNLVDTNLPLDESASIFEIMQDLLDDLKRQLILSFGPFGISLYYAILTIPLIILIGLAWLIYNKFFKRG